MLISRKPDAARYEISSSEGSAFVYIMHTRRLPHAPGKCCSKRDFNPTPSIPRIEPEWKTASQQRSNCTGLDIPSTPKFSWVLWKRINNRKLHEQQKWLSLLIPLTSPYNPHPHQDMHQRRTTATNHARNQSTTWAATQSMKAKRNRTSIRDGMKGAAIARHAQCVGGVMSVCAVLGVGHYVGLPKKRYCCCERLRRPRL